MTLPHNGTDTSIAAAKRAEPRAATDRAAIEQAIRDAGLKGLTDEEGQKLTGIDGFGLSVVEQVPIEMAPQSENRRYLATKKTKLGHRLHHQDLKNLDYEPENE